ncbi:MAG TPA: hypothetical protein VIV40_42320, partial [Kofleriaceae bacterium]
RALDDNWGKAGGPFDLTKVLGAAKSGGAPLVLVTDGLVADDRAVLAAAAKVGVPIHVIGIGPAPNRGLLTQIAATTGGTVRFATIGDDLTALARDVVADAASQPEPLKITWGTLAALDVVPATLPRLGAGQATLVVARVKKAQTANARVRGDVFGFVMVTTPRPPDGATTPRGSLARRWAKLKLDDLIAAGNAKAITEHALQYGLVSPYTSMVAIGDEVVVQGGVKHSVPITVSVPEGMRWQLVKKEITVDTTKIDSTVVETNAKLADQKADKKTGKKHEAPKPEPKQEPRTTSAKPPTTKPVQPVKQKKPADERAPVAAVPAPEEPRAPTPQADRGEADDEGASKQLEEQREPSPAPSSGGSVAMTEAYDSDGAAEMISVTGASARRRVRFSLALGAGVSVVNRDAAPLAGLYGRVDIGRRARFGGEASLWLVDGLHGEGNVLATAAYILTRRLELGFGSGLHFTADDAGPAFNLTLRTHLPVRGLTTYLRYDGALLLHDQTYDGQNSGSFGLEATF